MTSGWSATAGAALSSSDQGLLLDRHNQLRSQVALGQVVPQPAAANMTRLVWDSSLAQTAQTWANECNFSHNPNRGNAGENLFLASGVPASSLYQQGVDLWFSENNGYAYGPFDVTALTHGHYTQLVWATTRAIGCGATYCANVTGAFGNATLLVCNYSPPGNFFGQTPYVSGSSCTQCPAGATTCRGGLCSAPSVAATPWQGLLVLGATLLTLAGAALHFRRSARLVA